MIDDDIARALSELLSLRSSCDVISGALSSLNASLTEIALSLDKQPPLNVLAAQDSFLTNIAARLIDFVARCLLRLQNIKYGDDFHGIFLQLGQTMKLLQGFLLLHRASRQLFAMPCNMELLITCLTLPDQSETPSMLPRSRPANPRSLGISASPSLTNIPLDFTASTRPDASVEDVPTLAELTMETLLCTLADSPDNVKVFEELGGIGEVVLILRGKVDGGKAARMKALELLYFWLYPDTDPNIPSTPRTPTTPSSPRRNLAERPAGHIRRPSSHARLQAMLESAHEGWVPQTPSRPSRILASSESPGNKLASRELRRSQSAKRHSRVAFSPDIDLASPGKKRSISEHHQSISSIALPSHSDLGRSMLAAVPMSRSSSRASVSSPGLLADASKRNLHRRSASLAPVSHSQLARLDLRSEFKLPRPPTSPGRDTLYSPSSPNHQRSSSTQSTICSLSNGQWHKPPLSRSAVLARSQTQSSRTRDVRLQVHDPLARSAFTPDAQHLPGKGGVTRGLFASLSPAIGHSANLTSDKTSLAEKVNMAEQRRAFLSKYVGNAENLLERFDSMRRRA